MLQVATWRPSHTKKKGRKKIKNLEWKESIFFSGTGRIVFGKSNELE